MTANKISVISPQSNGARWGCGFLLPCLSP
nr:MAG TPA: hypothetical protein [Caudoviricetes sp.]DAM52074.1 MAG TPA: hypothetical protein [Bacteriophage sp.]